MDIKIKQKKRDIYILIYHKNVNENVELDHSHSDSLYEKIINNITINKNVILDLKNIVFFDASILGIIKTLADQLNKKNKKLTLTNIHPEPLYIINLIKLDQFMDIDPNLNQFVDNWKEMEVQKC